MKKILLLLLLSLFVFCIRALSQCTITNATGCFCPDGSQNCELLPDITISWYGLQNYAGGPTEYPQTGAGADNGRLRVTGSTPNIGWGPFTVHSQDDNGMHWFLCGGDTVSAPASTTFTCPDGSTPKLILWQRIYTKNGNTMTYQDRMAGPETYIQGEMHVDDWGIFSLRLENPSEPDPRRWPMVGDYGHKQSFCLMDFGSCTSFNGHCRDDQSVYGGGNVLLNGNFPNWGLGNSYGCSSVEQGCSVGYTDIYSESLNGMWINIPPGTCNGNYWIVYEIDPRNNFREMNETNNYTYMPFTLTLQDAPGNPHTGITASGVPVLCGNDSITLSANGALNYSWSNGATTQSIRVGAGTYWCTTTTYCGTSTSTPFTVVGHPAPTPPPVSDVLVCYGDSGTFITSGNNVSWYNSLGNLVGTGNSFTTPPITSTQTYYARDDVYYQGTLASGGKPDSSGTGAYYTGNQWLIFNALKSFILKSVKVYSNAAGNRDIQVWDAANNVIASGTFNIPSGVSQVNLNFNIPVGNNLTLHCLGTPNMWRNNGNVVYPYTRTDTLSITGSSAGANFYYFFYDWQIDVGGAHCLSDLSPANAILDICTGVNQLDKLSNRISVYPNPSTGVFTYKIDMLQLHENVSLKVLDVVGREVYAKDFSNVSGNYQSEIDLSLVSKGVYQFVTQVAGRKYFNRVMIR